MILVTIGPSNCKINDLKKILKFTNFVRLNSSHNSINWHEKISKRIKKLNAKTKILLDLPGIKMRTLNKKLITIMPNEKLIFYNNFAPKVKFKKIKISNEFPVFDKKTKLFSVSDGKFKFLINKIKKNYILCKSLQKFQLLPKQGLNIPFSRFDDILQYGRYINFIKKTQEVEYDILGLSYIQSEKIIKKIKTYVKNKKILSKIENFLGVKNFRKIVNNSDYVMVDRGDFLAELNEKNFFNLFFKIFKFSKKKKIPFVAATGNLESMIDNNFPKKNDIFTLGFYKYFKVDWVMLSEETATSTNWLNTLRWMKNFLK